ncbi:hypothetical protein EXIGLDRAFT_572994, partial [Exidia glandulosa HHB12029]
RTSGLRQTRFKKIQADRGVHEPRNLLRDMPVRWSSTKIMLDRAVGHRADIKQFVCELEREETNEEKRDALSLLHITPLEWKNALRMLELLQLADDAQIAFSAESYPTLYNAVPALTLLTSAWTLRLDDPNFVEFCPALEIALEKLSEYREIVTDSRTDAYWISMVLHPEYKFGAEFREFWGAQTDQLKSAMEKIVRSHGSHYSGAILTATTVSGPLREVAQATDLGRAAYTTATTEASSTEHWRVEYERFINTHYDIHEDMTLTRWWGMFASQLPTWGSLAADYLPIMSSSVSAERAFSSAALTLTKRRNRLKGDIVEALQIIKCALRNDLLTREPAPSSVVDADLVHEDSDEDDG